MLKEMVLRLRLGRWLARRVSHLRTDTYVVSYPKCGRTWLRVLTGRALAHHFGQPDTAELEPWAIARSLPDSVPLIQFTHDGGDHPPDPARNAAYRRARYGGKNVVFLVRDPRDVVVSYFFHRTRREHEQHELSEFIRHPWWGAPRIVDFMASWYASRADVEAFKILRYEDLHLDAHAELRALMEFVGIPDVSEGAVEAAVEFASFSNLRRLSTSGELENDRLRPAATGDPESFKVRRGKVGGYRDYLSPDDCSYLDRCCAEGLPPELGYS